MNANLTKTLNHLREVTEVVNAFKSEAVQVKVIDRILDGLIDTGPISQRLATRTKMRDDNPMLPAESKKFGATKILNQVLRTEFFNEPRTIAQVAGHCLEEYDTDFRTSELSGILLKLANDGKLLRQRNGENNRFEYLTIAIK